MTNPFCLLPQHADDFLDKVKSGELSGDKLAKMTSEERRAAFAEIVGDANAAKVNASFESRLLLKNQQAAIKTWIEKAGQLSPAVKRDMLSRVDRMEAVLTPQTSQQLLSDLARQRLGFGVTQDEAAKITSLAKNVSDARKAGDWDAYIGARADFREYTASIEGHGKMTVSKGIVAAARASALSWPTTILKLTSVALGRIVTTPVEDAISMGVAKALPGLAEGAPRLGSTSPKVALQAEAAAQSAMWTDGMIDAGRLLQNKGSRLDLAHNDKAMPHAWYEYFGSIHAALKEPIKRAEYARSLFRRTVEAAGRGEDVNDITVKMRLSTEAYKDGQRAVSMQDNKVSTAWNAALGRLEAVDKETGKPSPVGQLLSTALRTEMPVMKAPTNIVAEASQYIGGSLTGPAKAIWAYTHGIEDLKPVERDAIIREISKGAVGAAIMGLFYFKHDKIEFGGYYQQGEKRGPSDVPVEGLRIYGTDIPKQMIHLPLFQAGQFAATTARVANSRVRKADADPQGLGSALEAAAFGLIDEVPIVGGARQDLAALSNASTRNDFLPNKAANVAVPGLVQWIAKKADDTQEPRKATGLVQHLEANIPGLREKVPLKKKR